MYQTVLKRYELISPYPFFVAVKVFLITCLVLLVFVFSLVSPTESQDFLVLHMCEWASSLLSHPSGYPDCAWHIHSSQSLPSRSAGPRLIQACGSSSAVTDMPCRLPLPSCSNVCCCPTPQSSLFSSFSIGQDLQSASQGDIHRSEELGVWLATSGNAWEKGIFQLGKLGHKRVDSHWVKQEDGKWTQIWILPKKPQPQKYPSVLLHLFWSECHCLYLFLLFSFLADYSCNYFIVLNILWNKN